MLARTAAALRGAKVPKQLLARNSAGDERALVSGGDSTCSFQSHEGKKSGKEEEVCPLGVERSLPEVESRQFPVCPDTGVLALASWQMRTKLAFSGTVSRIARPLLKPLRP